MVVERPAPRYGWVFAAVWLFYLGENLNALLRAAPGWQRSVGLAALAGFAAVYVVILAQIRHLRGLTTGGSDPAFPGHRERLIIVVGLVLMTGLGALQIPGAGPHALTCLVYIAATAMMGLPQRQGIAVAAALLVLAEVLLRTLPGWKTAGHGYSLAVVLAAIATGGIRLALERQRRLREAQGEIAALAVADERARIAADLHDILGHSLTVVTVKAELAQRLLDVDLDRARAELRDLESLARDALADVRATALGMRGISLPGEIAAARQALAAANIEADLPGAADEVPTRNRELFAWTIREAVTNIVRHSGARQAVVRLTPVSVEIVDDGAGRRAATGGRSGAGGQGLAGLRRRADELNAHLTAGDRVDGVPGFRVLMETSS